MKMTLRKYQPRRPRISSHELRWVYWTRICSRTKQSRRGTVTIYVTSPQEWKILSPEILATQWICRKLNHEAQSTHYQTPISSILPILKTPRGLLRSKSRALKNFCRISEGADRILFDVTPINANGNPLIWRWIIDWKVWIPWDSRSSRKKRKNILK